MNMRVLLLTLFCTGCTTTSFPPVTPGTGQLVVALKAVPRAGTQSTSGYSKNKTPTTTKSFFQRVDYRAFPDIAVWLEGAQTSKTVPARLQITDAGTGHRLVVVSAGASLTLINDSSKSLFLYSQGVGAGIDIDLAPGQTTAVRMPLAGIQELYCDERDNIRVTIVITPTGYATVGIGGGSVYFDKLTPGQYTLCVKGARLPLWKQSVTILADERATHKVALGVHQLTK